MGELIISLTVKTDCDEQEVVDKLMDGQLSPKEITAIVVKNQKRKTSHIYAASQPFHISSRSTKHRTD